MSDKPASLEELRENVMALWDEDVPPGLEARRIIDFKAYIQALEDRVRELEDRSNYNIMKIW